MSEPSLLPPNATRLETELEAVHAERMAAISTAIRSVWDPDTCPASFLPFLAWQFSVDKWNPDWADSVKRAVIKASIPAHKIKGTRAAVESVIAAFGGTSVEITEWWETSPQGTPGTFELNLVATDSNGDPVDAGTQQDIVDAVEAVKRLSQHMSLVIGESVAAAMYMSPLVVAAQYVRFSGEIATPMLLPESGFAAAVAASSPYQWLALDDTTGTTAADSSGNARDGSYELGMTLDQPEYPVGFADVAEASAYADGVDGYIDTGLPSSLCDDDFTAQLLFRPDSVATVSESEMDTAVWYSWTNVGGGSSQIVLGIDAGHIALMVRDSAGVTDVAIGESPLAADAFYCVRLVHDASAKTIRVLLSQFPAWGEWSEEIVYTYDSLAAGESDPDGEIRIAETSSIDTPPLPGYFAGHFSNWIFWDSVIADDAALPSYGDYQGLDIPGPPPP